MKSTTMILIPMTCLFICHFIRPQEKDPPMIIIMFLAYAICKAIQEKK